MSLFSAMISFAESFSSVAGIVPISGEVYVYPTWKAHGSS